MVKDQKTYVPKQGDIIWVNFSPADGHEQKGKRPALVVSKNSYNEETQFLLACPITSKIKKHPLEVIVLSEKISGVVLSNHVKSMDWKAKKIKKADTASKQCLDEVIRKIKLIIF